jgi:hypothetical protein
MNETEEEYEEQLHREEEIHKPEITKSIFGKHLEFWEHRKIMSAVDNISKAVLLFDVDLFPELSRYAMFWIKKLPIETRRSWARKSLGYAKRLLEDVGV